MNSFDFKIHTESKSSRARRGTMKTPHGKIETPAFVTVGTKATVKSLTPEDFDLTGTQYIFVNTYHMVLSPGTDVIEKAGGVHNFSKLNKPIVTDSGGFQVFSLARAGNEISPHQLAGRDDSGSRIRSEMTDIQDDRIDWKEKQKPTLVKISEDGVEFRSHSDGTKYMFTPEFSIQSQKKIGADFIVAFDEDIHDKVSYDYTKKATERIHRWAKRSFVEHRKSRIQKPEVRIQESEGGKVKRETRNMKHNSSACGVKHEAQEQQLYGIIHGGRFEELRKHSAKTIAEMDFEALALGGESVGIDNTELYNEVKWVSDVLQGDLRTRHLLGIGTLVDIMYGVKMGFDTFDCVLPTRYARMGMLYNAPFEIVCDTKGSKKDKEWLIKITHKKYSYDLKSIDESCTCYTCQHYSRAYIHHLFKQRELLAYRLATIHNLYYIENFFKKIRGRIENNKL